MTRMITAAAALSAALATASPGLAQTAGPAPDDYETTILLRTIIQEDANGDWADKMPNVILRSTNGETTFHAALDFYNGAQGHDDLRLFFATASTEIDGTTYTAGLFEPFRFTGQSLLMEQGGLSLGPMDSALLLPGITGVAVQRPISLGDDTRFILDGFAGTKSTAINENFGAETGPGYDAPVYGGRIMFRQGAPNAPGSEIAIGHFTLSEGPAGVSESHNLAYATLRGAFTDGPRWMIYGEQRQTTQCGPAGCTDTGHSLALARLRDDWTDNAGWTLAGGWQNGNPMAEGYLNLQNGPWRGRIGVNYDTRTGDTRGLVSLSLQVAPPQ